MLVVDKTKCIHCGGCTAVCPQNALTLDDPELVVDRDKCVECGLCVKFCPAGALSIRRE